MTSPDCRHLFVYGTLMTSAAAVSMGTRERRALHAASTSLGAATTPGRLFDAGRYPLLVDAQSGSDVVHGEVLLLDDPDAQFADLDPYELFDPARPDAGEYRREVRRVRLAGGSTLQAWVYVYIGSVAGRRRFSDGRWPLAARIAETD